MIPLVKLTLGQALSRINLGIVKYIHEKSKAEKAARRQNQVIRLHIRAAPGILSTVEFRLSERPISIAALALHNSVEQKQGEEVFARKVV